ncbi:MAG TPA: hypothetical protein VHW24_26930 [Bryobacteraceae bacterium]|nr:hypothetical protein [Bryobacteraceae bacterium]
MRRFFILTPWILAEYAAGYVLAHWERLPPVMAVSFFHGAASGWSAKTTALPLMLGLIFALLGLLTAILWRPERLWSRTPVTLSVTGPSVPARDEQGLATQLKVFLATHFVLGTGMALALIRVVDRNLG